MSATHDMTLRDLRMKLDTARGILGDALDGVQRGMALCDEISAELEEHNLACLQAKLDGIHERAAEGEPASAPPAVVIKSDLFPVLKERVDKELEGLAFNETPPPGPLEIAPAEQFTVAASEPEAFKLSAVEPTSAKRERAERPIPADWTPKSSTRIRLASLGIDVGPRSKMLVAYREAMKGQTRKVWGDKELEVWAKAEHRQAGAQAVGVAS